MRTKLPSRAAGPFSTRFVLRGSRLNRRIFSSFFCFFTATTALFAQATSSLRGTVTDASGSAVTEAVVTLSDPSSGASRKVVSDSKGDYQLQQVMPGTYVLQVEKPGFTTLISKNVKLEVATPATLDCKLEIGSVGATVSVEADASSINTVDASLGNPFTQTQVRQLPLQTRNVVELLSIQPGVTQTGETLGARRDQNNITLDGVDVNDNQTSGINTLNNLVNGSNSNGTVTTNNQVVAGFNSALPVPLDSVQEFRVTVAGQGADQGRSSGGQVTLITKSGTNQLHGSFYEYNRNTFLAANNWFNNLSGIPREPLVRNQFGASLGGPVIKNRVFFFGNWERRIDASGRTVANTVPTESLKRGILTFKASDGSIQTLSPAEIVAVDPLHLGANPNSLKYLSQFPTGNDPTLGSDKGLNFIGFRFNAPFKEDDSAYVAKMDFNIDKARAHTLAVRGTLAGNSQDVYVAQYPGQSAAAQQLNNSKGLSALYTWVIKPSLINVATFGFTRLGIAQSGTLGDALTFNSITSPTNYTNAARPSIRQIPTINYADDLNWTKGAHNIKTGFNIRVIKNDRSNYANSFASYSFSRNTLQGLGNDAYNAVNTYIQQRSGNPALKLSDTTSVVSALGNLFGLINQYSAVYQFNRDGSIIPFGQPAAREFATNEYEGYLQDTWRIRRDLTLTYGIRYSNFSVPYETHGIQVIPTVGFDQYFAERVNAANNGIPNNQIKDASLTYVLGGPANNGKDWFARDKNNFGPRFSFAYAPEKTGGSWWSHLLGRGSVLRGGAAMVYDRYGSDLITQIDNSGSPGLATNVTQSANTNFTTSVRYGAALPALPPTPKGGFPYTPATISGGFDTSVGINPSVVAPYSFVLNLNYAKELPGKLTFEIGYAGRLARKNLLEQDYNQPLTTFKDPASSQTWTQASGLLREYYERGLSAGQIPAIPFFENQFPALANLYVPGSATANYFDNVYNQNAGSDLDALNQVDRPSKSFPKCISKTGCNTFFPLQNTGLATWTNAGFSSYHAGTLTVRRSLANGLAFDFNYTLSHSIDNSSGAESGAGYGGAVLQDSFHPNAFRGSSDFDARHNITTDILLQLPFGKGKKFLGNASKWVDEVIGGWQVSTLGRYRSGLPSTISNGGIYPTNYNSSAVAILAPGASGKTAIGFDQNGLPSIFTNTSANTNYIGQYPGQTGTRGIVRLAGLTNFDMAIAKSFAMPWEGHFLQFRGEAFNAFNNVNFQNPSLSLATPAKFGEFQAALPARVIQLSLRYQF